LTSLLSFIHALTFACLENRPVNCSFNVSPGGRLVARSIGVADYHGADWSRSPRFFTLIRAQVECSPSIKPITLVAAVEVPKEIVLREMARMKAKRESMFAART
jgi:hypothetical protein